MSFTDEIAKVSERVRKRLEVVSGEQATKMSLIVPFLGALGYDVSDPEEIIPEYGADFAQQGYGKRDKVDYAIAINGTIVMIMEAKARDKKPEVHDGQLKKYFHSLRSARVGIVTNGIEYRFFTDLNETNYMDDQPFFSFNILDYEQKQLDNLKFFHRDNFDVSLIKRHAEELVYLEGLTQLLDSLLRNPSDNDKFIHFLVHQLGEIDSKYKVQGKIMSRVVEKFKPIVNKALQDSLIKLMTDSISREMGKQSNAFQAPEPSDLLNDVQEEEQELDIVKVDTTSEELEAFEIIKSIASKSAICNVGIQHKDVVSYFGINVGKTTWWFLRLYLSPKKKSFVTRLPVEQVKVLAPGFEVQEMSASFGDAASRVMIGSVNDLNDLAGLILKCYENEAAKHSVAKAA